ncbi:ATP-dependent DNA helicase Q-like SIM isoform X2 [Solanum tuberosum]|uniref:ATP-dependent DNA helicase Q-like SIM isoform X2 n=1 Tax=Solanum tuberosum TaxID=4113 RepID=UPI00073A0F7B|nr:PREDICTED: ATP-dependent DNA helicase Q-like SIM isoform X2 [Solanum tuberosum]
MHDQCLKLAKHGVSACFLGSCQTDRSVEQKAMAGVYSIIYVCPETILRLIKLLQSLAESHGIALVAVHEVHCVSKWGHDFPPDYRYGMNTSCYRAKTLVEYFGEHFLLEIYLVCDICIKGPPERQNLNAEAMIILQVVATHCRNFADISYGGYEGRLGERPNIKALVSRIREQKTLSIRCAFILYQQFSASDLLWWRGLARLWEVEGFIREGYDMASHHHSCYTCQS